MTATLTFADIQFMFQQVLAGDTPAPGADPLAPIGIRTIDGTNNNISGLTLVDQFGNIVDTATYGNVNHTFTNWSNSVSPLAIYPAGTPGSMHTTDGSERVVSNLIADATAANPATATANLLTEGDPAIQRLPENSLFTFFGQFFDHGLDFVSKKDSGTVLIPVAPTDPLYNPMFPFIPVTRAELDPTTGDAINTTAPFVEQSQTYGSEASTTFYLMEYDVNGEPTGDLIHGANGGMGTWADVKANALTWAVAQAIAQGGPIPTEMLTDAHVLDIPDPAMWDVATASFLPGAGTGQAFIADIAHNANPGGGLTPDADTVINPHGFGAPPPAAGEYDNELLDAHYVSGDPRVNENTALTSIHQAFHGEHSRILAQIQDWVQQQNQVDPTFAAQWTGEMYFQAAKLANEMQYQHLVFEEFGRRMSPNIDAFAQYDININPNISKEFSQAVYRLGHSQLTDNVKTMNATGDEVDITLIEAFLNPEAFDAFGSGDFLKGGQFEQGAKIDEFVVDALRNFLVGLPLDLAAINIARGRELGLPSLNQLRADLFAQTGGEASLEAYDNWDDFGANLLNPASLVNFIAAYGTDAGGTLAAARATNDTAQMRAAAQAAMLDANFMSGAAATTGVDNIDLWIGGLAEKKVPFGLLGSTFDFIFAQQMIALQDGDRFYYLGRIGGNLLSEIEGQTLADLMMRSGDAVHLNGDVFGTPDALVEMGALAVTDFLKSPTELTAFVAEIIAGTHADNVIEGGAGNDTLYGEGGNDTLFGGDNNDHVYGGSGDDVIWGGLGFDKLRGEAGNDEIHGGGDDDVINGNAGDDVIFGDAGFDTIFAGTGNDTVHGGAQDDQIEGQEGDDVLFGDAGSDRLLGEEGNDILFGGLGADILAGGLGDDMLIGGAGGDALDGGVGGYDIASYEDWLATAPSGIGLTINMLDGALSTGDAMLDTFLDIEEVRGTIWNDTIVGNDVGMVINGNAGNDSLTGGLGDDTFIGGTGNDLLIGGAGIDTALFRGSIADFTIGTGLPGQIVVTGITGTPGAAEGADTMSGIEWLLFDDALVNTTNFQYAPLVNVTGTHERVQNGSPVIGELELDVNFVDGTPVPGVGKVVGNIEIADPDGANGGPVLLALAGPDAALFRIVNTAGVNKLMFIGGGAASFVNYEVKPVYHVTVTAADSIGGSAVNITINVDDVNDNAPVVTSPDRINVSEGTSPVSIVYLANAFDIDTTAEDITFILGGTDAAAFVLSSTGELRFADVPDVSLPADVGADNVYDVTITATDGTNVSMAHDLAIHVTPGQFNIVAGATPGPDNLTGTVANDKIMGLAGNDVINGQSGNDWIQGMAGDDKLYGSSRNDVLQGGDDADYINGGLGADYIDGGAGVDMASWKFSSEAVTVNLATGVASGGSATGDIVTGIEDMEGSANFGDMLTGDANDNRVYGRGGDDIISGGGGVDRLYGEAGVDTLIGGTENDVLLGGADGDFLDGGDGLEDWAAYYQSTAGVTVDLNLAGPQVSGGEAGGDTLVNIENIQGSNLADTLTGDGVANRIYGLGGNDIIIGGAGADKLYGHAGADTINGGLDNDYLVGGADVDTFRFDAAGFGKDVIGDYADGIDVIDVTGTGWTAANLTVTQVGANVMVGQTGSTDTIRLDGHLAANIDQTDFTGLL